MNTSILRFVASAFTAACLLSSTFAADPAKGGLRYSIGVTKFENKGNWGAQWALGDAWGAVLTDSLQKTGKFIVLGESEMRGASLQEQDLAATGRTAGGDKAPVKGNLTPAQLLIKGEITNYQESTSGGDGGLAIKGFRIGGGMDKAEINLTIYVVDSTTGAIAASKSVVGKASRVGVKTGYTNSQFSGDIGGFKKSNIGAAVTDAVDQAVAFIQSQVANVPWSGQIVVAKGDTVYINRGEREGVTAGQHFQVGAAEAIRDPSTGELLDRNFTKAGEIEVTQVKEKISICKVTAGADKIAQGMTVQP
jgi:curli biogenesis system outer membrane secretion channel CsgG